MNIQSTKHARACIDTHTHIHLQNGQPDKKLNFSSLANAPYSLPPSPLTMKQCWKCPAEL